MAEARADRQDSARAAKTEMLKARRDAHWSEKYGPDFRRLANEFPFPRQAQGQAGRDAGLDPDSVSTSQVLKTQAAIRARASADR